MEVDNSEQVKIYNVSSPISIDVEVARTAELFIIKSAGTYRDIITKIIETLHDDTVDGFIQNIRNHGYTHISLFVNNKILTLAQLKAITCAFVEIQAWYICIATDQFNKADSTIIDLDYPSEICLPIYISISDLLKCYNDQSLTWTLAIQAIHSNISLPPNKYVTAQSPVTDYFNSPLLPVFKRPDEYLGASGIILEGEIQIDDFEWQMGSIYANGLDLKMLKFGNTKPIVHPSDTTRVYKFKNCWNMPLQCVYNRSDFYLRSSFVLRGLVIQQCKLMGDYYYLTIYNGGENLSIETGMRIFQYVPQGTIQFFKYFALKQTLNSQQSESEQLQASIDVLATIFNTKINCNKLNRKEK